MKQPAVILCSGGIDSTTAMAIAREEGFALYALSIDYGQRNRLELEAARRVAESMPVERHEIVSVDLRQFGGSALTSDLEPPKDRGDQELAEGGIPVTYVPARNTIFLSLALAWAETLGARNIFIGINAVDYSGYPDCRPAYLEAFQRMAHLATRAGVEEEAQVDIRAPLLQMSKADIVRKGLELGVDYSLTLSCYDPDQEGRACGRCDSCRLRAKGFAEAGAADPTRYVSK